MRTPQLLRPVPWAPDDAPESGLLVLLGILGDLSKKKICDANLGAFIRRPSMLPKKFGVLGVDRHAIDAPEAHYLQEVGEKLYARTGSRQGVNYHQADLTNPADYERLFDLIKESGAENVTVLTAISSKLYPTVIPLLGQGLGTGLVQGEVDNDGKPRFRHGRMADLILEKPLGVDQDVAAANLALAQQHFPGQYYVMDHYGGRPETMRLLDWQRYSLTPRVWHRGTVTEIAVVVVEDIGIEGRVEYYDSHGAALDFLVNHLQLMLTIATMDHWDMDSEAAMLEVLNNTAYDLDSLVTGQYEGYRREVGHDSKTETFVGVRGEIRTDRWGGVPITLIHGKGGPTRVAKVVFKFSDGTTDTRDLDWGTRPGDKQPTPYENMLTQAYRGDFRSYPTGDVVLAQYGAMQDVLDKIGRTEPRPYRRGEWGPAEIENLTSLPWRH